MHDEDAVCTITSGRYTPAGGGAAIHTCLLLVLFLGGMGGGGGSAMPGMYRGCVMVSSNV